MLRFLKYNLFLAIIAVLMACSAPTTNTAQSETMQEVPDNIVLPGKPSIPDNIGDVIDGALNYWAGRTATKELFYLDKNGFDDEWGWRIRITNVDTGKTTYFYALSKNNSQGNMVQGDRWTARFFLKNENYQSGQSKVITGSAMTFTMELYSKNTARATFKRASDNNRLDITKDYGTFNIQAM